MKKVIITAAALITTALMGITANAEGIKAQDLRFEETGGGKFIYCNNPEAIDAQTLMNTDNPRYVMTNESLGEGKYYIYLSHYDFVDEGGKLWDMELDLELAPKSEDCRYTITNPCFETSEISAWYEGEVWTKYEEEWGMLNCCAKALNRPIYNIDGSDFYEPYADGIKEYDLSGGETRWLSEFIPNYRVVHYSQPVHIQAVLTIESGEMDVNVCTFKAGEVLGDRSGKRADAQSGIYRHDKTLKGVADTLPQVRAELEYEIDDSTADGTYLPVTLYNYYAPEGNTVNEWYTNINPLDDPWAKSLTAQSEMIGFKYADDSKFEYYGAAVPEEERDNVWSFDISHSDTAKFEPRYNAGTEQTYKPNFEVDTSRKTEGIACNMGNYGVAQTYDLRIENKGEKTRYFTCAATTNSNIIVYKADAEGEFDYALAKTLTAEKREDVLAVQELAPNSVTEFSVNVVLPVNYNGGVKNAFIIKDEAQERDVAALRAKTANRELVSAISGESLEKYRDKLSDEALEIFGSEISGYEIMRGKDGYLVRWSAWDGKYNYYRNWWSNHSRIYALDEGFELVGETEFLSLPYAMSYADGTYYAQTVLNGIWTSTDGTNWTQDTGLANIPKYKPEKQTNAVVEKFYSEEYDGSDWAKAELIRAARYELVPLEISEDLKSDIAREDFCKLASTLIKRLGTENYPENAKAVFSDTESRVCAELAQLGIVKGYEDGTFKPDRGISREEAAVMLARIQKMFGMNGKADMSYADNESISEWARDGVNAAAYYGVMQGTGGGNFSPKSGYTREQSIITMMRVYIAAR